MQQQNYSLEALAKRDEGDDPFGTAKPPAPPAASADGADAQPPQEGNQDAGTSSAELADRIVRFSKYAARAGI
jgi:hypothetical protein